MNSNSLLLLIVLSIACLASVASNIYAPAIPAIAQDLHTIVSKVQLSMAFYMFGLAISQLIYGPLSEGLGRRLPIILGLSITFLGSMVSWLAANVNIMIAGCMIQGCGAGACAALWRSIFRDVFNGAELAKYGSYLAIIVTFVVPGAPVLGGYLLRFFNWRASFLFLMAYELLTIFLVVFVFKETSLHHHKERLNYRFIVLAFRELFGSKIFMGYSLCVLFSYSAFFAWFVAGPVLLIKIVGISPVTFGWITILGVGCATMLASYFNGKFVSRIGMHFMLRAGWSIMIIAGVLMLAGKYFIGINAAVIVIPVILFFFGAAFIWPNAFADAFIPFGKIAGYAGALYGSMQIVGGAAISGLVAHIPVHNQIPLAIIFIVPSVLAWMSFKWIVKPSSS